MDSARDPVPFRPYQAGTQPPYDAPAYGSTHKRHPRESLVPFFAASAFFGFPIFTVKR